MASGKRSIDVLVLTAADGEDVALRAVEDGAIGAWQEGELDTRDGDRAARRADPSWRYGLRDFARSDGGTLRVAHVHARSMGETTAALVAMRFVVGLKPRLLAMCGVCAGRPNWTSLGDVVIAETIHEYDAGESAGLGPFEGPS